MVLNKIKSNRCAPVLTQTTGFFFYFLFFWLHWVFVALRGLSLVAVNGGCSLLPCMRWASLRGASLVAEHRL